jgi:hypothetical protein
MKISVNILGTSKNINRLRVLTAGAIRSKTHDVTMNFMAEGEKPSFLPRDWNWIPSEKYRLSDRHVHALIDGVANESYDYNIFCDDDVIIDVDKFVDQANREPSGPCVWTTWPGKKCDPHLATIIEKHARKYVQGRKLSSMWMGFCTSVINRDLCNIARKDHALLDSLLAISKELSANSFIPDLQISILGWLANAQHIRGDENMGTCWPYLLNSSVLCSKSSMWHVHATGESPTFPHTALINTLEKSPFDDYMEMMLHLFPSLTRGVKAKHFIEKEFDLSWFPGIPWRCRIDYPNPHDTYIKDFYMKADGAILVSNVAAGKWKAFPNGWIMKFNDKSSYVCFATYNSLNNPGLTFPVAVQYINKKINYGFAVMIVPKK